MGKRTRHSQSPDLVDVELTESSSSPMKKTRQQVARQDAALALLLFRGQKVVVSPEVLQVPRTVEERETDATFVSDYDDHSEACCSVAVPPRKCQAAPEDCHSSSFFCKKSELCKAMPSRPSLPRMIQRRPLPPLSQATPVPMAPKLAGHLTQLTRPISLKLE